MPLMLLKHAHCVLPTTVNVQMTALVEPPSTVTGVAVVRGADIQHGHPVETTYTYDLKSELSAGAPLVIFEDPWLVCSCENCRRMCHGSRPRCQCRMTRCRKSKSADGKPVSTRPSVLRFLCALAPCMSALTVR